jgi:3-hydroxyacyl-CoA dehydrogenase
MGSGIAAHLANLGFEVTLLDLTEESVQAAFTRAKAAKPPHFFVPETADKIRLGGIDKNLDWAAEADWVCEAIIEKMDAKRALFEKLDELLPETTAITTNTSGLQISLLAEGRSESFRKRFLGTHFFNPPRYLKLLELIPTPETDPEAVRAMTEFLEDKVARRVVVAKDTPGFIANRFGMWAMIHAIHITEKLGLSIEQVDAITGPFLGRPRSASFRLNDIVGLDIMQDIANNLYERCPHDPQRELLATPNSMKVLLERGWIGEKSGQGYYRREGKEFMAFDLVTHAYRQRQEASFPELDAIAKEPLGVRVAKALDMRNEVGEFLRHHLVPVLQYAESLKEEISHSVLDFDRVMMWGFGWEMGPFAMLDAIGGSATPYYADGTMRDFSGAYVALPSEPQYRQIKDYPVVEKGENFNLRDLGEGVVAVAITTKMGTITPSLVEELHAKLDSLDRFVLCSEARHFSLGFDLTQFLAKIDAEDWDGILHDLDRLQQLAVRLSGKRAVSAVHGYALGAGLELAFQCPIAVVLADAMIGFPESKVGLYPGGGGTVETALRSQADGAKSVVDTAVRLVLGDVSINADHARSLGYLRPTDITEYHPERLITRAREAAKTVEPTERPQWALPSGPLTGMLDRALDELVAKGTLSDYDRQIGDRVKAVFTKSTSFEDALLKERTLFIELTQKALTQARIRHMMETGKPLRN